MQIYAIIGLLVAMLLASYAQIKVLTTFSRFKKVASQNGIPSFMMARQLLEKNGVTDVKVVMSSKKGLSDNYNPTTKTVSLSAEVYNSSSVAAMGIAAHEVGHAIQHHEEYAPVVLRTKVFPVVSVSQVLYMPLIIVGLIIDIMAVFGGKLGFYFMFAGLILFGIVLLFQLITLPVEFDASKRATEMLVDGGYLTTAEIKKTKKVLSAAALTYVANTMYVLFQFIRLLLMIQRYRQ